MLPLAEYESQRARPEYRPVMTQRWRSLLFLHTAMPASEIQALLPSGLTVDTFPDARGTEQAWVGLVPFRMEGVTPRGFPEISGIHAFPETNVRTYVHRGGTNPGVWFFSLEAGNDLACKVARTLFHLPYYEANMSVVESENRVRYTSSRKRGGQVCDVQCRLGKALNLPNPGSLEFFLLERYLLYSYNKRHFYTGRVYHAPYSIRSARVESISETLVAATGIRESHIIHTLFSEGVDVEVFGLRRDTS